MPLEPETDAAMKKLAAQIVWGLVARTIWGLACAASLVALELRILHDLAGMSYSTLGGFVCPATWVSLAVLYPRETIDVLETVREKRKAQGA
jgi:hypothetical protein